MRTLRLAAGATAVSMLAALASAGAATAATTGVGTSQVSTNVLRVSVGTDGALLGLRVLGDDGRATTDKQVNAAPEAFSRLTALSLTSGLAAPLNSAVPAPPLESRTLGSGTSCDEGSTLNLTTAGVPTVAATGVVTPAKLCSAVDTAGARSNLDTTLANLAAVGGLVSADSLRSTMGAASSADNAEGSRAVRVDAVSVLDLGALLQGLGLNLSDLPVGSVSDLLDTLDATVAGVQAGDTLDQVVVAINDAIDQLQAAGGVVDPTLADALAALLGPVGVDAPTTGETVNNAIDALQGTLADVLENGLAALENLTLLRVDSAEVGVSTKATDSVANSAAAVTARVGDIHVGGITVPGLDLQSATTTLNATVDGINATLQETLGQVSPSLEGLLEISLFDKATELTSSGGYVRSRAGLTVLSVDITPPANLTEIVDGITDQLGIDEAIAGAGGTLPPLADTMNTLESTLNQGVAVLAQGASLRLVEVLSASDFAPVVNPGDELPRTGIESGVLSLLAGLLALLAIGLRRTLRLASRPIDG